MPVDTESNDVTFIGVFEASNQHKPVLNEYDVIFFNLLYIYIYFPSAGNDNHDNNREL